MSFGASPKVLLHPTEELLEEYCFQRVPEPALAALEEHLLICEACQVQLQNLDEYISLVKTALAVTPRTGFGAASSADAESISPAPLAEGLLSRLLSSPLYTRLSTGGQKLSSFVPLIGLAGVSLLIGLAVWRQIPADAADAATSPEVVQLTTTRGGMLAPNASGTTASSSSSSPADSALSPTDLSPKTSPSDAKRAAKQEAKQENVFAHASSGRALNLMMAREDLPATDEYRVQLMDTGGAQVWSGSSITMGDRLSARVENILRPGIYWVRLSSSKGKLLREFGLQLN